ncbi:MAG TPA: ROK family protein [Actinomycetota bacterium]|nr:ROK family protein [Actinomycetota bacterium]
MSANSVPDREAIGIDVGGTKIAAMRIRPDGEIVARETVPTPADDMDETLRSMIAAAEAVRTAAVAVIGVGAAGLVEKGTGILTFAPNLAWRNVPISERVGGALGLPTITENDANAAAWGEHRFGAGRGHDDMLLVTVGTGIGGGVVAGGKVFRGAHGFAAEIGHIIVEPGGPVCGCGNRGCWEQVASGHAIARSGRQAVVDHPNSGIAQRVAGDPAKVTGRVVTEAAADGDLVARGILAVVGSRLGEGIAGLVNVLDPAIVVVGGGAIAAGEMLLATARVAFTEAVEAPDHRPEVPIVAAELGNDAGAVGAAALALEELPG